MNDAVIAPGTSHPAEYPAPISLRELWPWTLFALALLALIYFVGIEESAASLVPGQFVHELLHDGRHLLAFPCH